MRAPASQIRRIAGERGLEEILPAWRTMAESALVPAGGALPGWIVPQLRADSGGKHAITAISGETGLIGVFPLVSQPLRWLLPLPVLVSWTTPLSFSGLPLLAKHAARQALETMVSGTDAAAIVFQSVPADGPFWDALIAAAAEAGAKVHVCKSWQRAALRPAGSYGQWFENNFERKRRKEYRRLRARLGEAGGLASLAYQAPSDPQPWIDELTALEARGWKGRRGTALASDPAVAACLSEALHAYAKDGALRFWKLALAGKAIAMMFAIVHGRQAWLGKIAYDEDFARFSPGALLILDATEGLMAEPDLSLIDSCAIPGHPLIDHMWRDRVKMADVLVSSAGTSETAFKAMVLAETARCRVRETARDAWYAMKGVRRS